MNRIVFDAHAILIWTQKEAGYKKVKSLMIACREGSLDAYLCEINLGEVYYKTIRAVGIEEARRFLQNLMRLPLNFVLPDSDLIRKASEIKAEYPISYADCFVAATALRFEGTILTGDPEFRQLGHLVSVNWL